MVPLKYVPQKPHTPDSAPDLAPYCLRNHRALGLQSAGGTGGRGSPSCADCRHPVAYWSGSRRTLPGTGYSETAQQLRPDANLSPDWSLTAFHQRFTQDDVGRTHSTHDALSFAGTSVGADQRRTDTEIRIKEDGNRINAALTVDTSGIDLAFSRSVGNPHLRYGASYYSDDINSERTDISTDGLTITQQIQGPVGDDATYTQTGLFAQWEQNFSDQIELIIGGRLSAIDADIGRYRDPATGNTASFSDSWQDASFGARASYALTPAHDQFLWASVSEAFRALDITAFHTEISDYIDTAPNRAHC